MWGIHTTGPRLPTDCRGTMCSPYLNPLITEPGGGVSKVPTPTLCPAAGKPLVLFFLLFFVVQKPTEGAARTFESLAVSWPRTLPWSHVLRSRPVLSSVIFLSILLVRQPGLCSSQSDNCQTEASGRRGRHPTCAKRGRAEWRADTSPGTTAAPRPEASTPGPGHLNPDTDSLCPRHTRPAHRSRL